jgi:hypothetical protein
MELRERGFGREIKELGGWMKIINTNHLFDSTSNIISNYISILWNYQLTNLFYSVFLRIAQNIMAHSDTLLMIAYHLTNYSKMNSIY